MEIRGDVHPKILILTISHGASHQRASNALRKALLELHPGLTVAVVDALKLCSGWFRAYYDSYLIPLKYWPGLWAKIENLQRQAESTGPSWLYRKGAAPLFRFIKEFNPDVLIATEVGMGELAAMFKRETGARFYFVALVLMDFNRAWVQPEMDLYPVTPGDLAAELEAAGVPSAKILPCGLPIDTAFSSLPDRETARKRLAVDLHLPLVLLLFGGTGHGKPARIVAELMKVREPLQAVFVVGRNRRLEEETRRLVRECPSFRVLGWVDNIHEWMAAADLLLSKPGGSTLTEAFTCGLPMLAFDPLPGNETRTCQRVEKWGVGHWIQQPEELAPTIERLLRSPGELQHLQVRARAMARPRAAHDAAEAILQRWNTTD